jgi:hypothetical protein
MLSFMNIMLKKNFISLFFLLCFGITNATFGQEVIASGGSYFSNARNSISYTMGETISETFSGQNLIITQGFQQPQIIVTSVYQIDEYMDISAFPNPVEQVLNLDISDHKHRMEYMLYNQEGKILMKKEISEEHTIIPLQKLQDGTYILKITRGDKLVKSIQIVKLN